MYLIKGNKFTRVSILQLFVALFVKLNVFVFEIEFSQGRRRRITKLLSTLGDVSRDLREVVIEHKSSEKSSSLFWWCCSLEDLDELIGILGGDFDV